MDLRSLWNVFWIYPEARDMAYPPTKLVPLKGEYYCTIPSELRDCFSSRKQYRLSTGTSDRREAELRQHGLSRKI
jgi:hypothetical protein